jgi:hypothetical protein
MTLMTLIFSLFGIVAWVIGGVLLYFKRKTLAKTELMRGVQTGPWHPGGGQGHATLRGAPYQRDGREDLRLLPLPGSAGVRGNGSRLRR